MSTSALLEQARKQQEKLPEGMEPPNTTVVQRLLPGKRVADKVISRFVALSRKTANIRINGYDEDPSKAAVFSSGRQAEDLETVSTEELLLIEAFLEAEKFFAKLQSVGHVRQDADMLDTIFAFRANHEKQPKSFVKLRIALYRTLIFAERRGGVVYFPVDETSHYAKVLTRLVKEFGGKVQPLEYADKKLPEFTVRCIGFSTE